MISRFARVKKGPKAGDGFHNPQGRTFRRYLVRVEPMSNNLIPTLLCVALGIAFGLAALLGPLQIIAETLSTIH
jgi:hypothetical protein